MTFHHFLVRIRRPVRHGFMGNNGLFMLVHTGHTRSRPPDHGRSRSRLHLVSWRLRIVDALMDIHGFSGQAEEIKLKPSKDANTIFFMITLHFLISDVRGVQPVFSVP